MVVAQPGRPLWHHNLGIILAKLGRTRAAIDTFAVAAGLDQHDHRSLNEISRLHAELGDVESAIDARRRAVARNGSTEYRNDLAVLLSRAGQHEESVGIFQQLLRENPMSKETSRNLGICLVDMGRKEEGFAELRRCIQNHPDWPNAYLALGGLLVLDGQWAEATRLMAQGMRLRGK